PGLLARIEVGGSPVGAVGYPLDALRRLNPLWRVAPRWPGPDEAMAGASLASRLGLREGDEIAVAAGGRSARLRLAATVETGGAEDENLFLPLALVQSLAGRPGQASLALVRARLSTVAPEEAARAIEAALPGSEARTLAQVARAEAALLDKVTRLLALVAIAIAAASAFTVAGTLGVLLLGRRREIGLCLALGGGAGRVTGLLFAEAAASGLAGGVLGCLLGAAAAEAIAVTVFGDAVPLVPWAAPLALAVALLLALGAAALPVRRAVRTSPCDTLRAP
ncbi:MAG TPA: ABC transporter permease, partial [Anaeromyxobacteraceae bacterium]|nr:ABC transporter permease [Anaeromyxobacteraceae bacterium]